MAKSKYETIVKPNITLIEKWCREGATDKQIAENLGIAYSTFREYVKQFSALSAPLKRGKEIVDAEVENSLLKRALGYSYDEITKEDDGNGLKVTKIVTKQVVPDTTAQIFWLKNRCPTKWRDKTEIEGVEVKVEVPENIKKLSTEELRKLAGLPATPPTEEFESGDGGGK